MDSLCLISAKDYIMKNRVNIEALSVNIEKQIISSYGEIINTNIGVIKDKKSFFKSIKFS